MTKHQFAVNMVNKIINKLDKEIDFAMWTFARRIVKIDTLVSILEAILTEYDKADIKEEEMR